MPPGPRSSPYSTNARDALTTACSLDFTFFSTDASHEGRFHTGCVTVVTSCFQLKSCKEQAHGKNLIFNLTGDMN